MKFIFYFLVGSIIYINFYTLREYILIDFEVYRGTWMKYPNRMHHIYQSYFMIYYYGYKENLYDVQVLQLGAYLGTLKHVQNVLMHVKVFYLASLWIAGPWYPT